MTYAGTQPGRQTDVTKETNAFHDYANVQKKGKEMKAYSVHLLHAIHSALLRITKER